jgi:hypothetical protein
MAAVEESDAKSFGPTHAFRVFVWLSLIIVGLFDLMAVGVSIDGIVHHDAVGRGALIGVDLFLVVLYVGLALIFTKVLLRPRIIVGEAGVEVINYHNVHELTWDEIERFSVGNAYRGISIEFRDGRVLKANAVQKTNLASWLGRSGRAERVVAELNDELSRDRSRGGKAKDAPAHPLA